MIIGDLKGLSSNAQVMVKMAVLSAWAELQVASTEQRYLVDVVKPHVATLAPLWLSSLRDFARLRFEPDISSSSGSGTTSLSGSIDAVYSALNRETLLRVRTNSSRTNSSQLFTKPRVSSTNIIHVKTSSTKIPGSTSLTPSPALLNKIAISSSKPSTVKHLTLLMRLKVVVVASATISTTVMSP